MGTLTKSWYQRDYHEPWWQIPESCQRSHFQSLPLGFPPAQQMAKRSRPSTDEASKHSGAPSKSKPQGKRVLALASVRHQKSSPLILTQEKTQSDVKGRRILSSIGRPLAFPRFHQEARSHRSVGFEILFSMDAKREQQNASSSSSSGRNESLIPVPKHRETRCSPR